MQLITQELYDLINVGGNLGICCIHLKFDLQAMKFTIVFSPNFIQLVLQLVCIIATQKYGCVCRGMT